MYIALGLLMAGLLALVVIPPFWHRALRLARARIEASIPMTRAEIEADKDQLRAGFAVANRRLEMEAERLREQLASETISTNRWSEEIAAANRLRAELEGRIATLSEDVAKLRADIAHKDAHAAELLAAVAANDARFEGQEAALAEARAALGASQLMNEELRLEMVARTTEIANRDDTIAGLTTGAATTAAELADARKRIEQLQASVTVLQVERTNRTTELERRMAEIRALESELGRGADEGGTPRGAGDRAPESGGLPGDNVTRALAEAASEKAALHRRVAELEEAIEQLRDRNAVSLPASDSDEHLSPVTAEAAANDADDERKVHERLEEIAAGVMRMANEGATAPLAASRADIPALKVSDAPATGNDDAAPTKARQHAGAQS